MRENEPNQLYSLADSFTKKRNSIRAEWLLKILPPTVDTQRIIDFLGGDTVSLVRQRMKEFPIILGGTEIEILGRDLREQARPALSHQFGGVSYLQTGEFLSDESETLTNEMASEQSVLVKAYWNDCGLLLGDNLGLLRMNALGYELANSPKGHIETLVKDMLETDINKRLADMEREMQETPGWLARKGLPKEGPEPQSELDERIRRAILSLKKADVEKLVASGVDPKIAEARVSADIFRPEELTSEDIECAWKILEKTRGNYPQMKEEHSRLKPLIDKVVEEILNKTALEHIIQAGRFSLRKK